VRAERIVYSVVLSVVSTLLFPWICLAQEPSPSPLPAPNLAPAVGAPTSPLTVRDSRCPNTPDVKKRACLEIKLRNAPNNMEPVDEPRLMRVR